MEGPSNSSDRAAIIFEQARQLAETAREDYLREACKDDTELRKLIDDLLVAHSRQGEFLAEPTHARPQLAAEELAASEKAGGATTELPASALSAPESRQIGRYKLLQRIGEGGFGEVWMAEQREPIKRRVALKIIKPGMDSRQVIARFEAERQALAMMDHPNIARVLDAGVTDAGRPYFVMELVRGVPITEYADTENLDPQARLDLFALVCNAVQHAHQKGIIHRDLKPSNVLVTVTDGKPVPKVIDFGIAKATGGELTDKTLFTEFRQFIGTPQYMSPEQAGMSGVDIDTRSDIYSLGVLLYELLTGVTPFDAARLRSAALDEMRRIIREEDPPRPSTRVSTLGDALSGVARHRRVEPARLGALIRGDLDWITMKCLEKDRSRRYGTASDLAADVQRHFIGEAVVAAPPSRTYRLRKFVRKHRGPVVAAGLVTGALVLGMIGTSVGLIFARAAEKRATSEAERASRIARFMQSTLFGAGSADELSANREVLRELIAGAVASGDTLDPQRWPNVRLALRLIEGHWRESPPSTAEFSRVLTDMLNVAMAADDRRKPDSVGGALAEHNARGVLLVLTGRLGEAEAAFRAALQLTEKASDRRGRLGRADQLTRLGLMIEAVGDDGARPLFAEALTIRREVLGPQHPDTAESMEDLAGAIHPREMNSIGSRLELLEECLAARRAQPGSLPESIARVITRIGEIKAGFTEGRADAPRYFRDALECWRSAYPGDHERVVEALIALGAWRGLEPLPVGLQERETLLSEAAEMASRLAPGDSRLLCMALTELAETQMNRCQLTAAAETQFRAMEMATRLGGDMLANWGNRVISLNYAALRLASAGDTAAAEAWYRRLVAYTDRPDNPIEARVARTNLRDFLTWCGRTDDGSRVIADDQTYNYPYDAIPYSQRIARELEWLGRRQMEMGNFSEAESLFRRQLATCTQSEPSTAGDGLLLAKGNLGWVMIAQRRYVEAEPLLLEACQAARNRGGRDGNIPRWEVVEHLLQLYDEWQVVEPNAARAAIAAKWRERLAMFNLASSIGEYLEIENVRRLLKVASVNDVLNYAEWKRARTFVRIMTGDWTEDPLTAVAFRELVARAVKTIDMQRVAAGSNVVVEPDKTSIEYIVAHAALCALDGRWDDADAALLRAMEARPANGDSDGALRLLGCQAAVKEALGQTGAANSLYRRVAAHLQAAPPSDPVQLATARLDVAATDSGDDRLQELRDSVDILSSHLDLDDSRVIRGLAELGNVIGWSRESDKGERAEPVFKGALERAERIQVVRPLLHAEVLRRYGEWLAWRGNASSRAVQLLERAVASYRVAGLVRSPQLASALQWLSMAQFDDGAYRSAAESMQESLEIRLSLGEARVCTGSDERRLTLLLDASDGLSAVGDLADAEHFYRAAVSIAERDGDGWYTKEARSCQSEFLTWVGRKAEAASLQNQAASNDPPNPVSYVDRLVRRCRNIATHSLRSHETADSERAVAIIQRGVSILDAADPKSVFVELVEGRP